MSNQRQIGIAMMAYATDHKGALPQSTHSLSSFRTDQAWIYTLAPYVSDIDTVRICPAEPATRKQQILDRMGSSYVLNDLVFDSPVYNDFTSVPADTLMLFILSEDRVVSNSRDHIHGGDWTSFDVALSDIEPDRHRRGGRASNRLKGSANYLYADGRVVSRPAPWFQNSFKNGKNPAMPGESP
ncbi:type II secretion system protein [Kiritimatiellota bacterium B12222]|nr:type II secretion system protein [Kiritimatiellota bacterium B12222]